MLESKQEVTKVLRGANSFVLEYIIFRKGTETLTVASPEGTSISFNLTSSAFWEINSSKRHSTDGFNTIFILFFFIAFGVF